MCWMPKSQLDIHVLLVGSKCKCLWQLRYRGNTAVEFALKESSVTDALVNCVGHICGAVQTSSCTPDLHCPVTAGREEMSVKVNINKGRHSNCKEFNDSGSDSNFM